MKERTSIGKVDTSQWGTARSVVVRLFMLVPGLVLVVCPCLARTVTVFALSQSEHLDTEVSTNVVLNAQRSDVRRFNLHLELAGTPTNDLEVALGQDSNTNGVLGLGEIEVVLGWRGGRYFIENVREWNRIESGCPTNALYGVLDIQLENDASFVPARFSAVCGGVLTFPELSTTPPPSWLYGRNWNLMRITRRGAGAPSDWVRCAIQYENFSIYVR